MSEYTYNFGGKKTWESKIASDNYKVFKDHQSPSTSWRENAILMENARFGRQYSQAEEDLLLKFRQAPLPISVSTAICDTADAMMVSAKPTIAVAPIIFPFDKEKEEVSRMVSRKFQTLIEKAWHDSLGNLQFDRCVSDYTNVGRGLLYIVPRVEDGEFFCDFQHLSWRYFYPDPAVTDPLYRKSDNMIYAMDVSDNWGYKFVKSIEQDNIDEKKFEEDWKRGAPFTSVGSAEDHAYGYRRSASKKAGMMPFIQRTSLEEQEVYTLIPLKKGINYDSTELPFRTVMHLTDDILRKQANGTIGIQKKRKFYLSEYTSIGALGYKIVYPISQYNIVPLVYDHRDSPYPYSRMWYLYPLQRALNKFVMSSIVNQTLLNSTKIITEENSLTNKKDWMMNAASPNAVLEYKLNTPGMSKPPIIVPAQPMSEAWLTMPKWLTYMMEYISGIYSTMMGDPNNAPDVFSTVASLQSAGGLKIKRRMAAADATLSVCGEVAAEFYKEYAPINGFTTHYIPGKEEETILYNQVDIKEEEDADGKRTPKAYVIPETDLRYGFRAVRFTSRASSGYESATEAALLTHLATQLGVKELVPYILKRVNMSDIDEAIEETKVVPKLQGTIQQLENQVKDYEKKTRIQLNQIDQLTVNLKGAIAKGKLDGEIQKFVTNPSKYLSEAYSAQDTTNGEK